MKTSRYIIALSILAAVCSCNKTEPVELPAPGDLVTITAVLPEDNAVKGAGMKTFLSWSWNEGDKITVVGETTETYRIKSGFSPKKAEFVGAAVKGTVFTIIYPGIEANETDWNAQVQTGNDNLDHLVYQASLNGVDDYTKFSFSPEWAESHGGTLKQTGVLKLTLALPASMTKPATVALTSEQPLFYSGNSTESKTNQITLSLQDCTVEEGNLVAWLTTSWNEAVFAAGTAINVVVSGDGKSISREIVLPGESVMKTGYVNIFTFTGGGWADETVNSHYAGGKGTSESPWIIKTADQLRSLVNDLAGGSVRYCRLESDIDLTGGPDWVPLNNTSPYDKQIEFDGNGKTIKGLTITANVAYPSFAGVLYGSIKNVTFEGAQIEGFENNTGVVGGYIGTGELVGNCSGVTVSNCKVSASNKNVAAFAGTVGAPGVFTDCHVIGNNTVTQTGTANGCNAAGFAGVATAAATFTNCTAKADVTNNSSYYTGGFMGQIGSAVVVKFNSCGYLGGKIVAGRNSVKNSPVAGFIGRVVKNAGITFTSCYVDGADITAPQSGRVGGFVGDAGNENIFTSCSVKNTSIAGAQHSGGFAGVHYAITDKCYVESTTVTAGDVNTGGFAGYPEGATITDCYAIATVNGGSFNYVGGFIGIGKGNNVIANCFEASTVSGTGTGVGAFIGYLDVAPTSITGCIAWDAALPFFGGIKSEGLDATATGNYVGTSGTISSQASALGWSTSIWDLTGDIPKLK